MGMATFTDNQKQLEDEFTCLANFFQKQTGKTTLKPTIRYQWE